MSTFQTELNYVIEREVNRRMGLKQDTIDKQAKVLFDLRERNEQLLDQIHTMEKINDEILADAERYKQAALRHEQHYRDMQSRYDTERAASGRLRREFSNMREQLSKISEQDAQALRDSADERQAMQHQLQDINTRLVALQHDSTNYHQLMRLIGAGSFMQAVNWVQFHQRTVATPGETPPACGSFVIGSTYDKDCNPRD